MNDRRSLDDREIDAILERLDRLTAAVDGIGRRLDAFDGLDRIGTELQAVARALESLAYASLGTPPPRKRP